MSDADSGPASPILPGEEQVQLTSEQQAVADQEKVEEMVHKMMKTRHVDYEKVFGVLESNEDLPNSTVRQGWRVAMPPHQARLPFLHIPQTPWLLVCIALPAGMVSLLIMAQVHHLLSSIIGRFCIFRPLYGADNKAGLCRRRQSTGTIVVTLRFEELTTLSNVLSYLTLHRSENCTCMTAV